MNKKEAWDKFKKSGKIEDYLKKHDINMMFETEVKDLIIKMFETYINV